MAFPAFERNAARTKDRTSRGTRLDAMYDQHQVVPDPSPWLQAWREGSRLARRRTPELRADIGYGRQQSERIDLYLPSDQPRNLPFAAFVPGGANAQAVRVDAGFPAKAIHRHGAAYVAIGYDADCGSDPGRQLDQIQRAWQFLIANASRLGLDPQRGHLLGHSRGAQLAALAAFDPALPSPPLSLVLLSGIYEMPSTLATTGSTDSDASGVSNRPLSPMQCIPNRGPHMVIAWGERELSEFRHQAENFAHACRNRGLVVEQFALPGRNHFDTSLELSRADSPVLTTLRKRRK